MFLSLRWGGAIPYPLYKPYRYVPPHRVGFLCRFGLKTSIHFAHFGLESVMVFEGTTECINAFIVSIEAIAHFGWAGWAIPYPLYKPYRYVPPHRVGFLCRFGLKTSIHFAHFGLESVMVFEGTTECINAFILSIPNELERNRNMRIRNGFE